MMVKIDDASKSLIPKDSHSINSEGIDCSDEEVEGDMSQPEVIEFKETDSLLEHPDIGFHPGFRNGSFASANSLASAGSLGSANAGPQIKPFIFLYFCGYFFFCSNKI